MKGHMRNRDFKVQEADGFRILTFRKTGELPASDLTFAERLRHFFNEEESLPSSVLVIHAPEGFLDLETVRQYWEKRLDSNSSDNANWFPGFRLGMEHLRGENILCQAVTGIRTLPKLVICGLQGEVDLSFLGPALACDYRILSEESTITNRLFEMRIPSNGGLLWFLVRILGESEAMKLLWGGDSLSAQDALRMGLVHRLVPKGEFSRSLTGIASSFAEQPRAYHSAMKKSLHASGGSLEDYLEEERLSFESWLYERNRRNP